MHAGQGPRLHRRSGKSRRWVAVKMRVRGAGHPSPRKQRVEYSGDRLSSGSSWALRDSSSTCCGFPVDISVDGLGLG